MLKQWITNGTGNPFYARRSVVLSKPVRKVTAHICGFGQFIFHINGQKVGDHELDPGWTNYNKYIQYVNFDVTELFRTGENVIGAEVGNGLFRHRLRTISLMFCPFREWAAFMISFHGAAHAFWEPTNTICSMEIRA